MILYVDINIIIIIYPTSRQIISTLLQQPQPVDEADDAQRRTEPYTDAHEFKQRRTDTTQVVTQPRTQPTNYGDILIALPLETGSASCHVSTWKQHPETDKDLPLGSRQPCWRTSGR